MSTSVQLRRGTTTEHATFTGAVGELTIDTTKDTAVVHDGVLLGGHPLLKENNPTYTGTLTGGSGVVNLGSGQLYKDASGKVGVGTSTPETNLHVHAASAQVTVSSSASSSPAQINVKGASNSYSGVNLGDSDDTDIGYVRYYNSDDSLRFGANTSEHVRITSEGNVGIGTVSPSSKLTVNGTLEVTAGGLKFPDGSTQISAASIGTNVQTFNVSGTWTKPTSEGTPIGTMARIQVWGGGGGAGRGTNRSYQSGGGGGGYNEITVPLSTLASSVVVTVAAGGVGRTGSTGSGTAGGNSSFGTLITAYGGGGGAGETFFFGGSSAAIDTSGGGGGQLTAGTTPSSVTQFNLAIIGRPHLASGGSESISTRSVSLWHGGTSLAGVPGDAVWGGGAGAPGSGETAAGLSVHGGSGGARNTAGTAPGGGGGANSSSGGGNGSNGASGRVVVTVW